MTESNVQPFEFRGNPVATVTAENGTVLFCAKHVATALGYSNTRDAIRKHCRHIDGVANRYPITDSLGRTQQAVFITEGDVYRLIASSKLTSAVELMKRNGNPNMPTQRSMEPGLFEVKETSIAHSDGHVSLNFTTKVTPKGQQYLIQKHLGCTPLDLEAGA